MKALFLCFIACALLISAHPSGASAAQSNSDCAVDLNVDAFGCRVFSSDADATLFIFAAYQPDGGESQAQELIRDMLRTFASNPDVIILEDDRAFGESHLIFTFSNDQGRAESGTAIVAFQLDEFIGVWSVSGTKKDPVEQLWNVYQDRIGTTPSGDPGQLFQQILPDAGDLPGYSVLGEDVASVPSFSTGSSTGSSNGELEVVSIDARDAGIGDGTIYVYADIHNGSGKTYTVVTLTATCKDASGATVGTGYGGVQNLRPKETATATVIILSVPTCDTYSVRIESAL